ncbi:MAG: glycosyltransferase family 4 protein [Acidimicrobiales bacterium]
MAEQLRRTVPGGIGTYIRGLVKGLAELAEAPALTLWASRPMGRGPRLVSRADPVARLGPTVTSALPSAALVRAWDRGLAGYGGEADVVHAPSLALPPRRAAPVAVTVHDLAWRRLPDAFPPRGRRWHDAALARALERASLFVTPSRGTADDLVAAGAPAAQVEVVDEGSDHLPAPDLDGARVLLARLGVDGPYLLSVSTLEPRKNLPRLVAAYAKARAQMPEPWPLLVVGPAGWGDAGYPQVEGVVPTGWVDDAVLAALYGRARAVAYVPLLEGFGLPALEAMACGVPVVASPMPSTGGAALEVEPNDINAIAAALVTATSDETARSSLVAAGTERARALTWTATARTHVDLWTACVARTQ